MTQSLSAAALAAASGRVLLGDNAARSAVAGLDRLAASLPGGLHLPGTPQYDRLRRIYAARYDFHPAAMAHCTSPDDVRATVGFARRHRLPLAVRCGGHSYAGYGLADGGVTLDLSGLNEVSVDTASASVRVGGGALVGAVDRATAAAECAAVMGECPSVGVGGLATGGGIGLLMGKHGLACDNLLSAQMVLADGRHVTASARENADLFWAIRGGGGNFGVVTEFTFRTHPVATVLGGDIIFRVDDPAALMHGLRDFFPSMPDELTVFCIFTNDEHGKRILVVQLCYCGDPDAGARVLGPLRQAGAVIADTVQPQSYFALQSATPAEIPPSNEENRSIFVPALDDAVIHDISEAVSASSADSSLWLIPLHGAVVRVPAEATAFSARSPGILVNVTGAWTQPSDQARAVAWTVDLAGKLEPHGRGRGNYVNIMGRENAAAVRAAYGPNYARLARLKRKVDPSNLFSLNQNILPA